MNTISRLTGALKTPLLQNLSTPKRFVQSHLFSSTPEHELQSLKDRITRLETRVNRPVKVLATIASIFLGALALTDIDC